MEAAAIKPHRNILVFSDGTGNSSGKLFRTNVWRLYEAVDLEDPAKPEHPRQFAYYDNGVGTSSFKPLAVLGGAFGFGLGRNVRDLYAFVCRTYRPKDSAYPGDKIYAFGFSRGAFTVRVLVGLMMNQGLVRYNGSEADLQRSAAAAYRSYRRNRYKGNIFVGAVRWLRDGAIRLRDTALGYSAYKEEDNVGREGSPEPLRVEFIGVWDTVAAYGLPVDELTRAVDQYIWPLSMPDRDLNPRVERAMHALSLDDERNTFHPQLWNEGRPVGDPKGRPPNERRERLTQVWFAGVHSDVGGGYPDDGVSYVPLLWIMAGACTAGVRFIPRVWQSYKVLSDENGPVNDSRQGVGGYYRYNPRRIDRLTCTEEVRIGKVKVHESVFRRIEVGQDGYAPIVLPPSFDVVRLNGEVEDGGRYLDTPPQKDAEPVSPPVFSLSAYPDDRERVFNLVWWRRIAYFVTLGATLLLALMPLFWPALPKGACHSRICFVSDVIDVVGSLLPGFVATWFDAFSSRPDVFAILAAIIGAGLFWGGVLEVRIRDAMRLIWYQFPATRPRLLANVLPPGRSTRIDRMIERLRSSDAYRATFRLLTHTALPFVFLLAVAYGAIAVAAQGIFAIRSSWGSICVRTPELAQVTSRTGPLRLRTDALCARTGLELKEAGTYRLTIAIPRDDPWRDGTLPAGPYGVDPHADGTGPLTLGVPLRRHIGQPWFKPMARIGWRGSDEYPLDPKPSIAKQQDPPPVAAGLCACGCGPGSQAEIVFASEIVARSSGELFIYVNDAVGPPPFTNLFYGNNHGSACLTVERIEPAR